MDSKLGNVMELRAQAAANLLAKETASGKCVYTASSDDPQMLLHRTDENSTFQQGWYLLEVELTRLSGKIVSPCLYPDYGPGMSEMERLHLPEPTFSGRIEVVICFKRDVRQLRFDPSASICSFEIASLRMTRLSKKQAAMRMLSVIARNSHGGRDGPLLRAREMAGALSAAGRLSRVGAELQKRYGATLVPQATNYAAWVSMYDAKSDLPRMAERVSMLGAKPLFSVIVPVFNPPEKWLRKCIESVIAQAYPHWELCLADDASPLPHVMKTLREYAAQDRRIKLVARERNGHISESSNSAIAVASGEWLVLLDHDDELPPDALLELASAISENPRWKLIYSDEDKIDDIGRRFDPYFKPDWNYDLFLSHNCISHLGAYSAEMVRQIGGFTKGMEGSQDWDLALRCIERLDEDQIGHIPKVLYHWRAIPGSTALGPGEKTYAHFAAMRAIQAHLDRRGAKAAVHEIPNHPGNYRVKYEVPDVAPSVDIIIPTRDRLNLLRTCVESVKEKTEYANYRIVIVDNQSVESATLAYFDSLSGDEQVEVLRYDAPFNYSAINNFAVSRSRADFICLMNNDIEVISPEWLSELVSQAARPKIGAVGAKLYFPDGTLQHAGVILGFNGVGVHAYAGRPREWYGQMLRAKLPQQMSAVTAACLLVNRETYDRVGGLDESLQVAYNDIDFCLKIRALGYQNLWTPAAELFHHESATRGSEDTPEKQARFMREVDIMQSRWKRILERDPAYNPNLAIVGETFDLAFPPRH